MSLAAPSLRPFHRLEEAARQKRRIEAAQNALPTEPINSQGHLPLHQAVWHSAPLPVVRSLLDAHPDAAKATASKSEWLPLHIALQAKADLAVIEPLLQAHPAAASSVSTYGWLPLHIAARRGASVEVVEALLHAAPEALSAPAESGDTPLMLARKYGHADAAYALDAAERRVEDRRREVQRQAERQAWQAADEKDRVELERLVQSRVEEQELANKLVESGTQQPPGAKEDPEKEKMRQLMEAMEERIEQETGEKEKLQQQLQEEQSRREELEKALEEAKANAVAAAAAAKKKGGKDKAKDAGDWKKHTAKNGKPFWYNKKTKERSWTDPAA